MSELTVLIDLDKTAFRTNDFIHDVADVLESRFGLDADEYLDAVDKAHIPGDEKLRHFEFFNHLDSLGLDTAKVADYLSKAFAGRDYAYDDLADFLDFLLTTVKPHSSAILTYGEQQFQSFKHRFAPSLGRLSCQAILQPKGSYIAEHFRGQQGIIIDDRPINGLPATFRQVLLTREQNSRPSVSYNNFKDIRQSWNEITNDILTN